MNYYIPPDPLLKAHEKRRGLIGIIVGGQIGIFRGALKVGVQTYLPAIFR